jgi:hypothetical protein
MAIAHYVMDGSTYCYITLPNIVKIVFGQVHLWYGNLTLLIVASQDTTTKDFKLVTLVSIL